MRATRISEGLEAEERPSTDFQEVVPTLITTGQDEDDAESDESASDREEQEIRGLIQGLEGLWGKGPLPADFRDVIEAPRNG